MKIFSDLLSKEMTRKDFLLHLGIITFTISGIPSLLKVISDPNVVNSQKLTKQSNKKKFGSGSYGI